MKKYSSIEEVQAYYENPAIDQSKLKKLLLGLDTLLDERESKLYFEEKESFVIGSLVDTMLTHEEDDFKKLYHASTITSKSSDTLVSIVNQVFDMRMAEGGVKPEQKLADFEREIMDAIEYHNYSPKWSMPVKVQKVLAVSEYFEDLKASQGKQIISQEELGLSKAITGSLATIPLIKAAISDSFGPGYEIYFQYAVYFEYLGMKSKGLIDILIVDRAHKTAWIIDVKTTAMKTLNFFDSIMKFRYDIQLGFYKKGIKAVFGEDWTIHCLFAVESTTRLGTPLQYYCDESLLIQAEHGRAEVVVEGCVIRKKLKGFKQLMEEYIYYEKTGFQKDILFEKQDAGRFIIGPEGIIEP